MSRFFLIIVRTLSVFSFVLSILNNNNIAKIMFVFIGLIVWIGGDFIYKKIRTKAEEKEDADADKRIKDKILTGANSLAELGPSIEKGLANKLHSIMEKADTSSLIDQLKELDLLRKENVLTQEEFEEAKKEILRKPR